MSDLDTAPPVIARGGTADVLAAPVRQHEVRVGDKLLARADFAYPRERLLIELDGWSAHGTRPAFHADRHRQNALVLAGWTILRFTWADIAESPAAVIAAVHGALAA